VTLTTTGSGNTSSRRYTSMSHSSSWSNAADI
jgi:hypothetical protein